VLLLCGLVANESAERFDCDKLYHPQRPPERNDKGFQRLADTLVSRFKKINISQLTKVYNKLTQGDPPTRSTSEWKEFVARESFVQQVPSHARESPKLASERQ